MAFDIDRYATTSEALAWQDLDFSSFEANPLGEQTLRSLRYMCDVEYNTVCYLRDLLVTPSHEEDEVSTFMTMWNREEFWHGEALAHVLSLHGIIVDYTELSNERVKLGWKEVLDPIKQSLLSNIVGKDYVGVHMSWGAVNEWSAVAAYRRLAALEPHPGLAQLLRRIAQQETRHVAFYASQARMRLAKSKVARGLTRFALQKAWGPVGSTIASPAEVKHVMSHLFSGPDGAKEIERLDTNIARLPGMDGLQIVGNAMRSRGIL